MYLLSRGSGDPVLFLHGIPTSCPLWKGVIERMTDQFTCMAVDLPGLGRTARAGRGFGELGAMVEQIEELRIRGGVERWHVVGHDAGCAIAVQYAHRHPERVGRLALLTPSMFPDLEPFFLFEMLRKPVVGEILAPLIGLVFWRLVMQRAFGGDVELDAAIEDFHAPFAGVGGAWRLMSLLRWGDPAEVLASIPEMLPQLMMPALIFHGSQDRAVPERFATRAASLIPQAEKVVLDAGHFLPMSDPGVIASRLRGFFEGGLVVEEAEWIHAVAAAD
jgi:pimeloyl-ACP methyl ester carboxylesterase